MAIGRGRHRQPLALQLHPSASPAVLLVLLLVSTCGSRHAAALTVQIPVDNYCQEPGHSSCSVCQQPIIIDNRNPCSVGAALVASTANEWHKGAVVPQLATWAQALSYSMKVLSPGSP